MSLIEAVRQRVVWLSNWSFDQMKDDGNFLVAVPYTAPIMFLMGFGRALNSGESGWASFFYGLAGIGIAVLLLTLAEGLRRIFGRSR